MPDDTAMAEHDASHSRASSRASSRTSAAAPSVDSRHPSFLSYYTTAAPTAPHTIKSVPRYASPTCSTSSKPRHPSPARSTQSKPRHQSSIRSTPAVPLNSSPTRMMERRASLRDRITQGSLIPQRAGSNHKIAAFTDFTRPGATTPASVESNSHTPSPASFSQPRAGHSRIPARPKSFRHPNYFPPDSQRSGNRRPDSIAPSESGKGVKPTSRIPMQEASDTGKGVESASRIPTQDADTGKGVKSASRIPMQDARKATMVEVKYRASQNSTATSMRAARGAARLDANTLQLLDNARLQHPPAQSGQTNASLDRPPTAASDTTLDTPALTGSFASVFPPTSSPTLPHIHTGPSLSESEGEVTTPIDPPGPPQQQHRLLRSPSVHFPPGHHTNWVDEDLFRGPPTTSPWSGPLPTIPSQAVLITPGHEHDDDDHVTNTLSHLEGKGSPPQSGVDRQHVLEMFPHLKHGFDRDPRDTSVFAANAAAAQKFLDLKGPPEQAAQSYETNAHISGALLIDAPVPVSKWSETTPSEQTHSCETAAPLTIFAEIHENPPPAPPKDIEPTSIGYPSRVSSPTVQMTPYAIDKKPAAAPEVARRPSSPTLGNRPGSGRASGQLAPKTVPGFLRTTAAAESKRSSKMPVLEETSPSIRGPTHRGRTANTRVEPPAAITKPRSRSRSRYVLDKINGMWSATRGKKETPPPVPRIAERHLMRTDARPVELAGESRSLPRLPLVRTPPTCASSRTSATLFRTPPTVGSLPSATLLCTPPVPKLPHLRDFTLSPTDEAPTLMEQCPVPPVDGPTIEEAIHGLMARAKRERNVVHIQNYLNFAQVLADLVVRTGEARISAEKAEEAAENARGSYEWTRKSLGAMHRMAAKWAEMRPN